MPKTKLWGQARPQVQLSAREQKQNPERKERSGCTVSRAGLGTPLPHRGGGDQSRTFVGWEGVTTALPGEGALRAQDHRPLPDPGPILPTVRTIFMGGVSTTP